MFYFNYQLFDLLEESDPTNRAWVIESDICCTHVAVVSLFIPIKPYEMNLSIDVRAKPVTDPLVSSDFITSKNGVTNVLESISFRSRISKI